LRLADVPNAPTNMEKPFLTSEGENPLQVANNLLMETNNDIINWSPKPSTAKPAAKPVAATTTTTTSTASTQKPKAVTASTSSTATAKPPVAATTASAAAPVLPALGKLGLLSLDQKTKSLHFGKIFFKTTSATATVVTLGAKDVQPGKTELSALLCKISKPTSDSIQFTPVRGSIGQLADLVFTRSILVLLLLVTDVSQYVFV